MKPAGKQPRFPPNLQSQLPVLPVPWLLARVQQDPALRAERVAEVQRRLAAGVYDTGWAAVQTAAALLDALD